MRSRTLAAVLLGCLPAGCGTMENYKDGWRGRTEPYGGVRIAADRVVNINPALAFIWPSWAVRSARVTDVGLSAVADTVTLPFSMAAWIGHTINDRYFPPDEPADPAWRRFWFNDQPVVDLPVVGGLPPEPVNPPPSSPPTPAPSSATPSAGR